VRRANFIQAVFLATLSMLVADAKIFRHVGGNHK
jgi:hypothetical protein